jgi:hypothetical protein
LGGRQVGKFLLPEEAKSAKDFSPRIRTGIFSPEMTAFVRHSETMKWEDRQPKSEGMDVERVFDLGCDAYIYKEKTRRFS